MSILSRLAAASDMKTLRTLDAEFFNYRFAKPNTRNKFHRRLANKAANLMAKA
jgi:hypothetical protein